MIVVLQWFLLACELTFSILFFSWVLGIYLEVKTGRPFIREDMIWLGVFLTLFAVPVEFVGGIIASIASSGSNLWWFLVFSCNVAVPLLMLILVFVGFGITPKVVALRRRVGRWLENKFASNQSSKNTTAAPLPANTSAAPGKKKRSLGPRWR